MDYEALWRTSGDAARFVQEMASRWAAEYAASCATFPDDLVIVDRQNGYHYLYDLAGALDAKPRAHAPRVVGVWGTSDEGEPREASRMRGFPRPAREGDDRGHLIARAAGGGYDINLLPMDATLNRGRSADGARFRALEQLAAASPGTLFFVRPTYDDDSDRPARFDVGVQVGNDLLVEFFENERGRTMRLSVLRDATPFAVDAATVQDCLDRVTQADALFARAWCSGVHLLTRAERCGIAGVTGHVAESVTEMLLADHGWHVLWHFTGPGRHGVDLVLLTPGDHVVAVEVKGTLVPGRIPRLSRRLLAQMSAEWVDKADNPGMAELSLESADVYGAVVAVNFADLTWRMAMTGDFTSLLPVTHVSQVLALDWLTEPSHA